MRLTAASLTPDVFLSPLTRVRNFSMENRPDLRVDDGVAECYLLAFSVDDFSVLWCSLWNFTLTSMAAAEPTVT